MGENEWSPAISDETRGSVKIPSRKRGKQVVKIGDGAFNGCEYITSILIPQGVESIGDNAFRDCISLTSVVIPDGVKSIGDNAFSCCESLVSVQIPQSVTRIGENAFQNCSSLSSVSLPDKVDKIGESTFEYCSSLKSAQLPANLSAIPDRMFRSCHELGSISIPQNVRRIGQYAFSGCSSLTTLPIPQGVEEIGKGAFSQTGLHSLKLPKTAKWIEEDAFRESALAVVELESGLSSTGDGTFKECQSLKSVKLPDTLTKIGSNAFQGCPRLLAISIPKLVSVIGDYAFSDCSGLVSIVIPDSVKRIEDYAFYECSSLSTVELGVGLERIGESAFQNCSELSSILLPNQLLEVGNDAFRNCSSLIEMVVPDSVRTIGDNAFRDAALSSVTLPERFKKQTRQLGIRRECKITHPVIASPEKVENKDGIPGRGTGTQGFAPGNVNKTNNLTNNTSSAKQQLSAPSQTFALPGNGTVSPPASSKVNVRQPGDQKKVTIKSQTVKFRWCPATTSDEWKRISGGEDYFMMGSPANEEGRVPNEVQHPVTLTKGFWMGETEVTQGLWKEIMGSNPSRFNSDDNCPVEKVSWFQCREFVKKLNSDHPQDKLEWALPTEAQWEYACRAGTTGAYGVAGNLESIGWHESNSGGATHQVAQRGTNAWGLCDMHGNVWEWCADVHGDYPSGSVTDPVHDSDGTSTSLNRSYRGGSWSGNASDCRSAFRGCDFPARKINSLGFRVVLVPAR